jgi:hypothetical protein
MCAICRRFRGICEAELLIAMQKVEGSNPFSRLWKGLQFAGLLVSAVGETF